MWTIDFFKRIGKFIITIYKDGQAKGTIEASDEEELDQWLACVKLLNELTSKQNPQTKEQKGYGA